MKERSRWKRCFEDGSSRDQGPSRPDLSLSSDPYPPFKASLSRGSNPRVRKEAKSSVPHQPGEKKLPGGLIQGEARTSRFFSQPTSMAAGKDRRTLFVPYTIHAQHYDNMERDFGAVGGVEEVSRKVRTIDMWESDSLLLKKGTDKQRQS